MKVCFYLSYIIIYYLLKNTNPLQFLLELALLIKMIFQLLYKNTKFINNYAYYRNFNQQFSKCNYYCLLCPMKEFPQPARCCMMPQFVLVRFYFSSNYIFNNAHIYIISL